MDYTNLLALTTFAVSMSISPGPNNMMVAASGANFGFMQTLPHMLGIAVGFPMMLALVGAGADGVITLLPKVQGVMQILGTAYLLYLAYLISNSHSSQEATSPPKPFSFLQAALFQWVNPKAWVMALSAIASFSAISTNANLQILTMCVVFFLVALPSVACWTFFGSVLSERLKTQGSLRNFNRCMALLLVLSVALSYF